MGQSIVINPSGDPSGDFSPSSRGAGPHAAVVSPFRGDSGDVVVVVSKKKSYACQFCGRVCRNAQALGGHMNVHRRERALAKQLLELSKQGAKDVNHDVSQAWSTRTAAATAGVVAVAAVTVAAAAASDHHHPPDVYPGGGSSSSSSSPPSSQPLAIASESVHPLKVLHRLPSKNCKRCEVVDLELRLGFNPRK